MPKNNPNTLVLTRRLKGLTLSIKIKKLLTTLNKNDFFLKVIPKNGDFSEYINYVLKHKNDLRPETEYVKKNLSKGESWGEILVVEHEGKIVASFGPNRTEKDNNDKIRGKVGYFTVLPEFRNKKIGTVLWWAGLERLKKWGSSMSDARWRKKIYPPLKFTLDQE